MRRKKKKKKSRNSGPKPEGRYAVWDSDTGPKWAHPTDTMYATVTGGVTNRRQAQDGMEGLEYLEPDKRPDDAEQYAKQLRAGIAELSHRTWAMNLVYLPGFHHTRFAKYLLQEFGQEAGIFTRTGINPENLNDLMVLGELDLTDDQVGELARVTQARMNRGEDRVKLASTVKGWYTGNTVHANSDNMKFLAQGDGELAEFCRKLSNQEEQSPVRTAYFRLRLISQAVNEFTEGRNTSSRETRELPKAGRAGASTNDLNAIREEVGAVADGINSPKSNRQFRKRARNFRMVDEIPEGATQYRPDLVHPVGEIMDLQTVLEHRLVLNCLVGEAVHLWARDNVQNNGTFLGSILNNYLFHYGRHMEGYKESLQETKGGPKVRVSKDVRQVVPELHRAIEHGRIDEVINQQLDLNLPPRTVYSAIQGLCKLITNLPKLYWRFLRCWSEAYNAEDAKQVLAEQARCGEQLKNRYQMDAGDHRLLVDNRMFDNNNPFFCTDHDRTTRTEEGKEEYFRTRRWKHAFDDGGTFVTKEYVREVLQQYGILNMLPLIPPNNFEELPKGEYNSHGIIKPLLASVSLRLPRKTERERGGDFLKVRYDDALFPTGIPLIWFGMHARVYFPDTPQNFIIARKGTPDKDAQIVLYEPRTFHSGGFSEKPSHIIL